MSAFNFFRRRSVEAPTAAHMTWASKTIGRTLSRTGVFLRRQMWVVPILAILVLGVMGFGIRVAIEQTMKSELRSQLQTLLNIETEMLQSWMRVQTSNAETQANQQQVRELVYKLLTEQESDAPDAAPVDVSLHRQLRKELAPAMASHNYVGYIVFDTSRKVISSSQSELIGKQNLPSYEVILDRALEGDATVSPPFPSVSLTEDEYGRMRTGVPTMFVCAPIRDASFQVVAALALRMTPEREFTRILQLGQIGESGETYAFNKSGVMLSNSRFDDDLILLGLIPDQEHSRSILSLQIRDPQGNMTTGFHPKVRRSELPLTKMAAAATSGISGYDVDGYRDYRGVPVVGAWVWLPKLEMGLATEIDTAEAYRPLTILRWTFFSLFALLGVASLAIFIFSIILLRMRREAQMAELDSKKLGQYTLERKLGSGGMGVVYKGFHAILRRPTAIKTLHLEKVNEGSIERFEREVQITCKLNHPNTVAIYDFGRTEEGLFFYAMEYLDGIDLQTLVDTYGPQSESRVIHILQQVCGSLYEAHSLGLVHRDIKPANIMLNRRGGEPDVVKVLDFGLVKALDEQKQAGMTGANSLTGTPLYMSPESIETPDGVDARSDLYAVGAVGYFLLTGRPVFDARSIVDLCQAHLTQPPAPPSERMGKPVNSELETALLACLEKSRARRPQTARDLALRLARSSSASLWSIDEADGWWSRHERGVEAAAAAATTADPPRKANSPTSNFERTIVSNEDYEV